MDAPYIQAVLAEFEAACEACEVPILARMRVLSLDVALQQGHTAQVGCILLPSVWQILFVDPGVSSVLTLYSQLIFYVEVFAFMSFFFDEYL